MARTQLPSNIAQLVGVFVESILYGVYLVTFFASLRCMFWPSPLDTSRRLHYNNHRSMFTIVLLLFIFSTFNLALGFVRIIQALINNYHVGSGTVEQLGQSWVNILKPLTVNIQTTVADYAIIYRCWVVYSRSWKVIALPSLLWLAECACSIWSIYAQAKIRPGTESRAYGVGVLPIIAGIWSSTICLNIYATSMIVYKIWHLLRENAALDDLNVVQFSTFRSKLTTTMKIVIDSGLMYTITSIAVFLSLLLGSNSMYITTAINMQVVGIAFNLILIRVTESRNELTTIPTTENIALRFANTRVSFAEDADADPCDANQHSPNGRKTEGSEIPLGDLEQGQKEKMYT